MTDKTEYVEVTVKARFYGGKAAAESLIEQFSEQVNTDFKPLVMNHNIDNKCDITVTDKTKR